MKKVYHFYKYYIVKAALTSFAYRFQRRIGRMFGVSVKHSFSQFGEDIIIDFLLNERPDKKDKGIFIDVGCNHPIAYNNFYKFYLRGWRGINIDGNKELISLYKKYRPADISINAVVTNYSGKASFALSDDDCVSQVITEKDKIIDNAKEIITDAVTLNDVIKKNYFKNDKIDVLCIDVEGHEFEVVQSINLEIYSPYLIIVEMHDFTLESPEENLVYNYLKKYGYKLFFFATSDGYFVKR